MNKGLIIGKVVDKSGNQVSNAEVIMPHIRGMAGGQIRATGETNSHWGSPKTKTDSDGLFSLIFAWSGTEIGAVIGGGGRTAITLAASIDVEHDNRSSTMYTSGHQIVTGHMVKDTISMTGLLPPNIRTLEGFASVAKKAVDVGLKLKSHPLFKTNMLTAESWLIYSIAGLVINKN